MIVIDTEYPPPLSNAASGAYPQGSFKNVTTPTGVDGSPCEQAWPNDLYGFMQRLVLVAGVTPSGVPDTALVSDLFDATEMIFNKFISVNDAGTGATVDDIDLLSISGVGAPVTAYADGQLFVFKSRNTNTGPMTVDLDSIGSADLKNSFGQALEAYDVIADKYYFIRYDAASGDFQMIVKPEDGIGFARTPMTEYSSATDIKIGNGEYDIIGATVGRMRVYWKSQLTYSYTTLAASTWSYLYIDESSLTPGVSLLTNANFIDSIVAPVYNHAKGGWYNGDDRCITASYGTGANVQRQFYHATSNYIEWGNDINIYGPTDVDLAWLTVTAIAPAFCSQVELWALMGAGTPGDAKMSTRVKGSSGNGKYITEINSNSDFDSNTYSQLIDSSLQFEVVCTRSNNETIQFEQNGWYLPIGM